LGVATGEQGTVLRYVKSSKLADMVLEPLTAMLLSEGYTGYIDVNCIVEENGSVWPLEFTCRPGWPTLNIQLALQEGDPIQWLKNLADGHDTMHPQLNTTAVGVVMSIPDFPYSHITRKEVVGVPIYNATPLLWKHMHPCEMMLTEAPDENFIPRPMPCTAGDYVLVMTATGPTIRETAETVYRRLKRLIVPNSPQWRTDIGMRLAKQLPMLQAKGFASSWDYSRENQALPPSRKSASAKASTSRVEVGTAYPTTLPA
jgi:phosphoribosylamine--glycine ligase